MASWGATSIFTVQMRELTFGESSIPSDVQEQEVAKWRGSDPSPHLRESQQVEAATCTGGLGGPRVKAQQGKDRHPHTPGLTAASWLWAS